MEKTLTELLQEYDNHTIQGTTPSKSWISNLLKEMRRSSIRRPDIVIEWGSKVLSSQSNIELWNLHEQICIAALELGDYGLAESSINILGKQFSSSHRVNRLRGMLLEAQEKYDEARELYDQILKADASNIAARKRKISIAKAVGNTNQLVEEINQLLYVTPADVNSWLELGELYLHVSNHPAAIHCFEEMILLDPKNAHYHTRLADALYSLGGAENILSARKHYTISLTNQAAIYNIRALYSLIACCQSLLPSDTKKKTAGGTGIEDHDSKVNRELLRWAQDQLTSLTTTSDLPTDHILHVMEKHFTAATTTK